MTAITRFGAFHPYRVSVRMMVLWGLWGRAIIGRVLGGGNWRFDLDGSPSTNYPLNIKKSRNSVALALRLRIP